MVTVTHNPNQKERGSMTTATQKSEFRFRGIVRERYPHSLVSLYIDGTERLLFKNMPVDYFGGDTMQLVDIAFQRWITNLLLPWRMNGIQDEELLAALRLGWRERRNIVPGLNRTYRFLPAQGCTSQNLVFVFTTDKSDIEEDERMRREDSERVRLAREERARQVALGSKGNLVSRELMERYRASEKVSFSARSFNSIEYRAIFFGSDSISIRDLSPMLDIRPQDLVGIFKTEHAVNSYDDLGSLRLDDEDGFVALATLLGKKIEVWKEDGSTGKHYYLFSVSPR